MHERSLLCYQVSHVKYKEQMLEWIFTIRLEMSTGPVKEHQLRDLVNVVNSLLPSVIDLTKIAIPKEAST